MATGIRISQLPSITAMTDDDILIVNDGDTSTRKITYSNFKTAVLASVGGVTSINGLTGVVTLTANDLSAYTKAEVDAVVGAKASSALIGVADGASDLGTFVGSVISANNTVKGALQELETALASGDSDDASLSGNNTFTGNNIFSGTITGAQVGNVIPFYFDNQAAFPSASTYHGAIAHSHADGKMYFAHGGGWVALANGSEVFSGAYGDLTGLPTLGTASAEDVGYFATAAQGTAADTAVQPGDIGTAAAEDVSYFATAAQGTTADAALPAASVSAFGLTLVDDADAAAARTTLGLGDVATTAVADYATAAQGTAADSAVQPGAGAITVTALPTDGTATVDQLAGAINTLTAELAAVLNT